MTYTIQQALDKCYEIEGLLLLTSQREDTENIVALANTKIDELKSMLSSVVPSDIPQTDQAPDGDDEMIAEAAELEEEEDADEEVTAPKVEVQPEKPRLSTRFTLGDKYYFQRELFGNDEKEFIEALNIIQSMNTIDELKDYLYNDLCLNPENPAVKEFFKIVEPDFNL